MSCCEEPFLKETKHCHTVLITTVSKSAQTRWNGTACPSRSEESKTGFAFYLGHHFLSLVCTFCTLIKKRIGYFILMHYVITEKVTFLPFFTALSEDIIKVARDIKPVVEIQQKGDDFVVTSKTPKQSVTNSFTLGKEADITTMDGKKLKVTNFRNKCISFHLYTSLSVHEWSLCVSLPLPKKKNMHTSIISTNRSVSSKTLIKILWSPA